MSIADHDTTERRQSVTPTRTLLVALATALSLAFAAAALAATPTPGKKFTGFTSVGRYNGFRAAVGFKVSTSGKQLLTFFWQDGGCIGIGGPGNAYADPYNTYKIATIPVAANGTFAVKSVPSVTGGGADQPRKTTTSTISGRFTTATTATGTIAYTMKVPAAASPCSGHTTFTAHMR